MFTCPSISLIISRHSIIIIMTFGPAMYHHAAAATYHLVRALLARMASSFSAFHNDKYACLPCEIDGNEKWAAFTSSSFIVSSTKCRRSLLSSSPMPTELMLQIIFTPSVASSRHLYDGVSLHSNELCLLGHSRRKQYRRCSASLSTAFVGRVK